MLGRSFPTSLGRRFSTCFHLFHSARCALVLSLRSAADVPACHAVFLLTVSYFFLVVFGLAGPVVLFSIFLLLRLFLAFSPVPVGASTALYRVGPLLYRFVLFDRPARSNFLLLLLGFIF